MAIDLEKMSEKELKDLRIKVDKALATIGTKKLEAARKAAEEAARKHGYSLTQLLGSKVKSAKTKGDAKYRNPADAAQTWTGKGRQPGWVKEHLAAGKPMTDLAI